MQRTNVESRVAANEAEIRGLTASMTRLAETVTRSHGELSEAIRHSHETLSKEIGDLARTQQVAQRPQYMTIIASIGLSITIMGVSGSGWLAKFQADYDHLGVLVAENTERVDASEARLVHAIEGLDARAQREMRDLDAAMTARIDGDNAISLERHEQQGGRLDAIGRRVEWLEHHDGGAP